MATLPPKNSKNLPLPKYVLFIGPKEHRRPKFTNASTIGKTIIFGPKYYKFLLRNDIFFNLVEDIRTVTNAGKWVQILAFSPDPHRLFLGGMRRIFKNASFFDFHVEGGTTYVGRS
jgi:hypothetical protein